MNEVSGMPVVGRATGEDPSARVKATPLLKVLRAMKFDTNRMVSMEELQISARNAMLSIVHVWADSEIDYDQGLCNFIGDCISRGFGFRHYKNTWCLAVFRDGKHLHAKVSYGCNTIRVYFEVDDVYLEDDE